MRTYFSFENLCHWTKMTDAAKVINNTQTARNIFSTVVVFLVKMLPYVTHIILYSAFAEDIKSVPWTTKHLWNEKKPTTTTICRRGDTMIKKEMPMDDYDVCVRCACICLFVITDGWFFRCFCWFWHHIWNSHEELFLCVCVCRSHGKFIAMEENTQ